jgi:hypothetical protein
MNLRNFIFLLFTIVISGCEENWGDKIETFVDKQVHELSRSMAEGELSILWFDYFSTLPEKIRLALEVVNKLDSEAVIPLEGVLTFSGRQTLMHALDVADAQTIEAARVLEAIHVELSNTEKICDQNKLLYDLDVTRIGERIAAQLVVPEPEWSVQINCSASSDAGSDTSSHPNKSGGNSCLQGIVTSIASLFRYTKERDQKDKAERAIARIPVTVVSASEVEVISRALCTAEHNRAEVKTGLDAASKTLSDAFDANKAIARDLIDIRQQIEAKQMPFLLQKIEDETGITRAATDILKSRHDALVKEQVEDNRKDLNRTYQKFGSSTGCAETLARAETYNLSLSEKRAQLEAALAASTNSEPRLVEFLSQIVNAQSVQPSEAQDKIRIICK